jgi:hypothetical protein
MTGSLKVYGYYSPTLKKWNIVVGFSLHNLDNILTLLFSQLAGCLTDEGARFGRLMNFILAEHQISLLK